MSYFEAIPKIEYVSRDGRKRLVTNVLASVRRRDSAIVKEYMLFDAYTIQDGDTPEIVADKIYGHSRWWWIVLLSSGKTTPDSWPCSDEELESRIEIQSGGNPEAVVGFVDERGLPTSRRIRSSFVADGVTVNWHEHGQGLGAERNGIIRARGSNVTIREKMIADNESKKNIQLLNVRYLNDFVSEYERLMKSRVADGSVDF